MSDLQTLDQSIQARRKTLAEWRAGQRHELTLPSGLPIILRDVTLTDLAMTGKIPQTLMSDMVSQAGAGNVDLAKYVASSDFGTLLNELAKLSVVEPPIADVADEEHISVAELNAEDKLAIMEFVNRDAAALQSFRTEPSEPVDFAQPGR
jgi:hypothetical protein